jgi:uncharacterized protein YndB with AHSA1/START domain
MSTKTAATATTVQVHRVYIKASAQAVWDAIVDPGWNERYGYRTPSTYDLRPGGAYSVAASAEMMSFGAPEVILSGEVLESEPPRKLVQTWHPHFGPEIDAEGPRTVTWDIEEQLPGVVRLTVTHDVTGAPLTAAQVNGDLPNAGGGWPMIMSDLKTLLETGSAFGG